MKRLARLLPFAVVTWSCYAVELPAPMKDLNTPRVFPEIKTRAEWETRAKDIRTQVLVSCGLWPLPEKTPLGAHIFGRIERGDYTVEKVYFQTYPGFYLAGNLYRPLGKGNGPFPGILNPHGHWAEGRMADTKDGSIAARCISFARQGMIAFSYDMVGYNDSRFPDSPIGKSFYEPHRMFGTNRTDQLWNISLMGLQTWNTIRALDFLASLPDVDTKRLGCTGASGGGTQTFMLGAVDDRLAAQAPCVMVSHTMQGGCSCENAPSLRVEYSNMEVSAAAAPRPQILVAATGDWTKTTLEVEGPSIQKIYDLFGATDRLRFVRYDFGHNYNQASREAVYDWFGHWLLHYPDPASLKEQPYEKERDEDLRVFTDGKLLDDALPKDKFTESLKQAHRERWQALVPKSKAGVENFKAMMLPAWRRTLLAEVQPATVTVSVTPGFTDHGVTLREPGEATGVEATWTRAADNFRKPRPSACVVFAAPDGDVKFCDASGAPVGIAKKLGQEGFSTLVTRNYSTVGFSNQFANFFTTYNRTKLQSRVRDLTLACKAAQGVDQRARLILVGSGRAGLWSLLAAPAADSVVADCGALDVASDEALLEPDLFCPGIRNLGTFQGAAMLAAPHPLLLHNTGDKFPTDAIRATYRALGASKKLRIESRKLTDAEIAQWIASLK